MGQRTKIIIKETALLFKTTGLAKRSMREISTLECRDDNPWKDSHGQHVHIAEGQKS